MHFDLFDDEHFGATNDFGLGRSQVRRRKKQPGKMRIFISHCLSALGWFTQDFARLVRT